MTRYFLGITGASGHLYAQTLLCALIDAGHEVDLCVTEAGAKVMRHELGLEAGEQGERLSEALPSWIGSARARSARAFPARAIDAPAASGTALAGGVILCPCSMGTLARVSIGFSSNLVERAADVALKEGRPLLLVPRETPLSTVHLENMLRLSRLGAIILPAMPGFYHQPKTLADLVEHVTGKILDRLGVEHALGARWNGLAQPPEDQGLDLPGDIHVAPGDLHAAPGDVHADEPGDETGERGR